MRQSASMSLMGVRNYAKTIFSHDNTFPQWVGRLSYKVNVMATDDLARQVARVSAGIFFTYFLTTNNCIEAEW